jgi:hypothetical protein
VQEVAEDDEDSELQARLWNQFIQQRRSNNEFVKGMVADRNTFKPGGKKDIYARYGMKSSDDPEDAPEEELLA